MVQILSAHSSHREEIHQEELSWKIINWQNLRWTINYSRKIWEEFQLLNYWGWVLQWMPKTSHSYLSLESIRARAHTHLPGMLQTSGPFWILFQLKVSKCLGSGGAGAGPDFMLIKIYKHPCMWAETMFVLFIAVFSEQPRATSNT